MEDRFSCNIRAEISGLPEILDALTMFMTERGWGEEAVSDVSLAVDEAVTNVILHGYEGVPDGVVTVRFEHMPERLTIVVEDRAPPFDPTVYIPDGIDGDISDRREGGLGIILIRNVMDEVSYRYAGGMNILTMRKNRK